jgi:hypothetical protein
MTEYSCNPSTEEAEAWGLQVWGQPRLHSKFEANLGYRERPSQKPDNNNNIKKKKKLHLEVTGVKNKVKTHSSKWQAIVLTLNPS